MSDMIVTAAADGALPTLTPAEVEMRRPRRVPTFGVIFGVVWLGGLIL